MTLDAKTLRRLTNEPGETILSAAPEGLDALALADLARAAAGDGRPIIHAALSDKHMARLAGALAFFAPEIEIARFPAWDCMPYDRVSPSAAVIARRMAALARLARRRADKDDSAPLIVLTSINAITQRTAPVSAVEGASLHLRPGMIRKPEELAAWLSGQGFSRTGAVMEPGGFAARGSLIDLFAPGAEYPVRLDFFGDELESIRAFDPATQRSTKTLNEIRLEPASEILLDEATIGRFRTGYVAAFGGDAARDPLYEAVREGRRHPGMEHWLPLFYERPATLFDHAPDAPVSFSHEAEAARAARMEEVAEYHAARIEAVREKLFGAEPYKLLPIEVLYLPDDEWKQTLAARPVLRFSPFEEPDAEGRMAFSLGGRKGRGFAAERAEKGRNVHEAARDHIITLRESGRKVLLAGWTDGSRDRLAGILADHGLAPITPAADWAGARAQGEKTISAVTLGLESGLETESFAIVCEQDILGDRLIRRTRKTKRPADFLTGLSEISPGDLVVHADHGIGRFEGLKTITAGGAPHDCLHLTYAGGDRLFLPVENIDMLTRYGGEEATAQLDKLGGAAWQARKARLKERLREIAGELIRTAAARELLRATAITPPEGLYDEFCARFPFEETEDQLRAIQAVFEDMQKGRPMDRLVCGDVGFGKTEVALRAAFAAVMAGHQVAVIAPTTLLARQHAATFMERFHDLPVNIAQASRMLSRKQLAEVKQGLRDGTIDIVIGTHALLARDIAFRDLGLLVIDEEQHFGVKHKERLKALKTGVHVLTLTATPIPRTLQLALSGVRELSLIATPPVDRLAVRTFFTPFDPVSVREALLREHYRGGQSFYVVPRVSDLEEVADFLRAHVPEVSFATAHGRMTPTELDEVMSAFYDRKFDVLLATTIIESGLDIPSANTMIVHRADMFGLAQLYQLRGRVGRSRTRAYCLLTVPAGRLLTPAAKKRLEVLQSLDHLGAGFTLASHDLDIRGAGNLLGEEQSGHIKEVGFELYQQMLEEAVASLKTGEEDADAGQWSPNINIGAAVLIPESYVSDLQLRMGLYRRLAGLEDERAIDEFAAELQDRFGPLPEEVSHLLEVVAIKTLCRAANIATLDAGAKGAVIGFHNDAFPNPAALVPWINDQGARAKLRPDMKLVVMRRWEEMPDRLRGVRQILRQLAALAAQGG